MRISDLIKKQVAILGYGLEGKAVARYLLKHGVKPVLFDEKPWEDWTKDEQEEIKRLNVNFIFGPGCFKELWGYDIAFRSPGIKIADVAQARGLPVKQQGKALHYIGDMMLTSQTKWFFEHCPAKIIGVTGTKGKGTTCSLIYEMLHASRFTLHANIYLTGNIGKDQPFDFLDALSPSDWVVYELSSFQLQDLDRSPHIAVVLMLTSEHLDYHTDQKEYAEAKSAITRFQNTDDIAIINADFEHSVEIGKLGAGKKIFFSRKSTHVDCYVQNDAIVFVGNDFKPFPTLPIAGLQLRGAHNLENVCAAALAASCAGADELFIAQTIKHFKGLDHRLKFSAEKQGIKFYNDSFSTTPETAIAAIKSFAEPEVVILGGSRKNSDFRELGRAITGQKNIKTLILIGQETERIKQAIADVGGFRGKILEGAKSMQEIFKQIKSTAVSGDVVLLSPACASFDMFKNYIDRGEQFVKFAKKY